jgi:putative membrane protein
MSELNMPGGFHGSVSDHFAWLRTVMALQRSLMAAVRTSTSLIGFGFTVAQFFQRMQSRVPEEFRLLGTNGPRDFGLILIAAGVISMVIYTSLFDQTARYLRSAPFDEIAGRRAPALAGASYTIAFTVMLIGVAAFVSVFIRL